MASSKNNSSNKHASYMKPKPRAQSTHRKKESDTKLELRRSLSVEKPEKKVINAEGKFNVFINISEAFKNILKKLEFDENYEEANEKLLEIQNLINGKINYFKLKAKEQKNLKLDLGNENLSISKSLTSSMQSVYSECSETDISLDNDEWFSEFLVKVSCPFCSKFQDNKVTFIKHLDENCEPHKNCIFEKSKHMPFSAFQILPNSSFKCNVCPNSVQPNIKQYIIHLLSEKHVSIYTKAAQTKGFSEHLFCSCCKIQVANTYTQLNFHIKHDIHKLRSDKKSADNYLQKGIQCVYTKSRKFKCLICPYSQSSYETTKEILKHLEKSTHIRNNRNHLLKFYCEFCSTKDHIYQIINHFNREEHKRNVEEYRENVLERGFEVCFYCGYLCYELKALSNHMKSKCFAINEIREKYMRSAQPEVKTLQETKSTDESGVVEKKEFYIIVKGNTEIPKLFKYFMKFGAVTGIEAYKKTDLKVKFREEKTVEDILLLRNVLQIDGVKLEITTDEKLLKPVETTYSNDRGTSYDDSSGSENNELQDLFERVSSHLLNNAQKTDSELLKKLVEDCIRTLEVRTCNVVGFSGCGLSFPVENINFYCEEKNSPLYFTLYGTVDLKSYYSKMCSSKLWDELHISIASSHSYIACVHKETLKACTVTFDMHTMALTNLLRDCLKNKKIVQDFCLIIRFWLSIHELKIRDFEYVIISIIVFFLIKENVVNIPLQKFNFPEIELRRKIFEEDFGLRKTPATYSDPGFNVQKLFHKFLLFLETFDFDKNAICLPIDYPVPKTVIRTIIKEGGDQLERSPLWIFDPVRLGKNLACKVTGDDFNSLLKIAISTVKHYKIQ